MRYNLLGSCITQSISAFTFYFVSYYTKYWAEGSNEGLPDQNFYFLFTMLSFADTLSMAFIKL